MFHLCIHSQAGRFLHSQLQQIWWQDSHQHMPLCLSGPYDQQMTNCIVLQGDYLDSWELQKSWNIFMRHLECSHHIGHVPYLNRVCWWKCNSLSDNVALVYCSQFCILLSVWLSHPWKFVVANNCYKKNPNSPVNCSIWACLKEFCHISNYCCVDDIFIYFMCSIVEPREVTFRLYISMESYKVV